MARDADRSQRRALAQQRRAEAEALDRRRKSRMEGSQWRFHSWTSAPTNLTYAVWDGTTFNLTAADQVFAAHVHNIVAPYGWILADASHADYALRWQWSSEVTDHSTLESSPVYGSLGGGTSSFSSTTYGPSGPVTQYGTVTTPYQYGVVGERTKVKHSTITMWTLRVSLLDVRPLRVGGSAISVFQGQLRTGAINSMADSTAVVTGMLDTMFTDFPGTARGTRESINVYPRAPLPYPSTP